MFTQRRLAGRCLRLPRAGMPGQLGFVGHPGLQAHLARAPGRRVARPGRRIGHDARPDSARALRPCRSHASRGPEIAASAPRPRLSGPAASCQRMPAAALRRASKAQAGAACRTAPGQKLGRGCSDAGARSRPGILVSVSARQGAARNAGRRRHGLANRQAAAQAEPQARPGDAEGPAAVAALAQRLARSAIGVLEASELENAKQVDFEHLDADEQG